MHRVGRAQPFVFGAGPRAALAEAKRRGKVLGLNGRKLAARNREVADGFAYQLRAKLDAGLIGLSYSEMARQLNDAGVLTVTGRKFYPQTVKNYLTRQRSFSDGEI